jgi:hypothetical protein
MPLTVTGKIELSQGFPSPPGIKTITIRGQRLLDTPIVFVDPGPELWALFAGNAGAIGTITYEPGPPPVVTSATVK